MEIREISISRLKEYENNPRNNDLAVEKVKLSIKKFGFLFPIVIDLNYVIVCGHTRVRACKMLGIQNVPCIIADELTEEQINLFRLIDNKTSEYSEWDFEKLQNELSLVDLTIGENQLLLEQFELNAELIDIPAEVAELDVDTFNYLDSKPSRSSVSTIRTSGVESHSDKQNLKNEIIPQEVDEWDYIEPTVSNDNITSDGLPEMSENNPAEQRQTKSTYKYFRFGEIVFYISETEFERLNSKYAEYIDKNLMQSMGFADYLLMGVESID